MAKETTVLFVFLKKYYVLTNYAVNDLNLLFFFLEGRERERESKIVLPSTDSLPSCPQPEVGRSPSGSESSVRNSYVSSRDPATSGVTCCLLRCTVAAV